MMLFGDKAGVGMAYHIDATILSNYSRDKQCGNERLMTNCLCTDICQVTVMLMLVPAVPLHVARM